jgi:RNA polymerase sigma-70 factor (ECF subfamily)
MAADDSKLALSLKEERRIIRRIQKGDRAAFRTLYHAHAQDLYSRVIFPKVPVADIAEDILRETFLVALEQIERFRWQERSIRHWLRRIASNKVIDYHRANQRAARFIRSYRIAVEPSDSDRSNPERELADAQWRKGLKERIAQSLAQLNPRYRRAIELRFFQEQSRAACAEALEVSVATFDVVLFRALKRLKKIYEQQHDES